MIYIILNTSSQLLITNFYHKQSQNTVLRLRKILLFFLRSLLVFSLINFVFVDCIQSSPKEEFYYFVSILLTGIFFPIIGTYLILELTQPKLYKKQIQTRITYIRRGLISIWIGYFLLRTAIIFLGYQWFTTLQFVFIIFFIIYAILFIRYLSKIEKHFQRNVKGIPKKIHILLNTDQGKNIYEFTGLLYICNIIIFYFVIVVVLDVLSLPPYYIASIQKFFWEGFKLGSAHIIPINYIYALSIVIFGSLLGKYISYLLVQRKIQAKSMDLDRKMTIVLFAKYMSISISLLIGLLVLGVSSAELSVIIGGIGVGLGMGLRDLVMDFIAGMLLLVQKTIHIGDYISIDNNMYSGQVLKILPLSMQILLSDHTTMYIPNSYILKYSFTNHSSSIEIEACFFLFRVKNITSFSKIQKIIFEYLATQKEVLMNSPYQPHLNVLNMNNWEQEQDYDTIHLQFNLSKNADKTILIAEIKKQLNQRLKSYLVV